MKPIQTEHWIIILFVGMACAIVLLRSLAPLLINSDASVQIGAALSLLNGEGLGTYILNDDLSQPPKVNPLTWFAPGFSLTLFLLLKVGFSVAIALKFMYGIATILGWFGWALIFRDVIQSQQQTFVSNSAAVLLALGLPLYFTYDWVGTDLFLWAGIPFIIRLFYLSELSQDEKLNRYFWLGCLVGLMYVFRYASAFIFIGFLLLFLIRRKGFIKLRKITLGFGIFLCAVSLYRIFVKTTVPTQLTSERFLQIDILRSKLSEIINSITQFKFLLFSHLNHYYIPGSRSLVIVILLVLLFVLIWGYPSFKARNLRNPRIEFILCLNFALIIFLALISFFSSVNFLYLGDQRYYYPLFPSLTLLIYEVGFCTIENKLNQDRIIKTIALLYLGVLAFSTTTVFLRAPHRVFGFWEINPPVDIAAYPSNEIRSRFPESDRKVIELLHQNPKMLAISFAQSFIFSHLVETDIRKRMLPVAAVANVNSNFLSQHTLSQEIDAFLIFGIDDSCKTYCYHTTSREVELMKQIPPPQLVYKNEIEKIRVFSTKLPKGLKVVFSSQASPI